MLSHKALFVGLAFAAVFCLMVMAGPAVSGTADSGCGAVSAGPEGIYHVGQQISIMARGVYNADAVTDANNGTGMAGGTAQAHKADPLLGAPPNDRATAGQAVLTAWAHGDVTDGMRAGVSEQKMLTWQDIGQYQSSRWAIADANATSDPPWMEDPTHACAGCDHNNNHQPFVYNYEVRGMGGAALEETPDDLFGEVLLPGEHS